MAGARGTRASQKIDARERARAARLRLDAEREERDRRLEAAATAFFVAEQDRADLRRRLAQVESEMARQIDVLRGLGESTTRIAQLLEIDQREVRALTATLTVANEPAADATSAEGGPTSDPLDGHEEPHDAHA